MYIHFIEAFYGKGYHPKSSQIYSPDDLQLYKDIKIDYFTLFLTSLSNDIKFVKKLWRPKLLWPKNHEYIDIETREFPPKLDF